MQVDPIKPALKPPGSHRLKLKYDKLLSNFAFRFNSRRYSPGSGRRRLQQQDSDGGGLAVRLHYRAMFAEEKSVGMYRQDGTGLYAASIPAADLPASGKGVIISRLIMIF